MARRSLVVMFATVALLWGLAAATAADQPVQPAGGQACQGLANAYAHAADPALASIQAAADRLGCDLANVTRVTKPARGSDGVGRPQDGPGHQGGIEDPRNGGSAAERGPDVAAKCDRIAEKLAVAQARPHGKSADAFSRQAARWGCESS
jgi:hypothetical protein